MPIISHSFFTNTISTLKFFHSKSKDKSCQTTPETPNISICSSNNAKVPKNTKKNDCLSSKSISNVKISKNSLTSINFQSTSLKSSSLELTNYMPTQISGTTSSTFLPITTNKTNKSNRRKSAMESNLLERRKTHRNSLILEPPQLLPLFQHCMNSEINKNRRKQLRRISTTLNLGCSGFLNRSQSMICRAPLRNHEKLINDLPIRLENINFSKKLFLFDFIKRIFPRQIV